MIAEENAPKPSITRGRGNGQMQFVARLPAQGEPSNNTTQDVDGARDDFAEVAVPPVDAGRRGVNGGAGSAFECVQRLVMLNQVVQQAVEHWASCGWGVSRANGGV